MTERDDSAVPSVLTGGAVGAIRRTSAVDTVRVRIALAVDLGLLTPGERLPNPRVTAAALGVGEITVRRAFSSLEREGVVRRAPGRSGGTFVSDEPRRGTVAEVTAYHEDSERVHRLIEERTVLETGFTHLAAQRAAPEALEAMDSCIEEMDEAGTWAEFHAADERFHFTIARGAGATAALGIYRRVVKELYSYFLPYPMDYLRKSNEEHKHIRAALGARDASLAAGLVCAHVADLHRSMYVGLTGHGQQDGRGGPRGTDSGE